MAAGDFSFTAGKQRAVWVQTGGSILVGDSTEHFDVIVVEAGTAVREDFSMADDTVEHGQLVIPIMVLPAGASLVKTVAIAAPTTIGWNEDADSAIWGVDQVHVEEDTSTRQLSIVASLAEGGEKTGMPRIAYHSTIFLQGQRFIIHPEDLKELQEA
jgi:hypothetical protein